MATHGENDHPQQAGDLERYRSTPLRPAVWMTSVLTWATVVALILRVPTWAGVFLCTITGVSFLVFLVGYIYLFARDREALRSERYRRGPGGRSSQDVAAGQRREPTEGGQRTLGPEGAGFAVRRPDAGELQVRMGEVRSARKE